MSWDEMHSKVNIRGIRQFNYSATALQFSSLQVSAPHRLESSQHTPAATHDGIHEWMENMYLKRKMSQSWSLVHNIQFKMNMI